MSKSVLDSWVEIVHKILKYGPLIKDVKENEKKLSNGLCQKIKSRWNGDFFPGNLIKNWTRIVSLLRQIPVKMEVHEREVVILEECRSEYFSGVTAWWWF